MQTRQIFLPSPPEIGGGGGVIRPVVEIPRNQTWFWSEEWQEQIAQSMKEIEKGKVRVFKSVKEAKKEFGN